MLNRPAILLIGLSFVLSIHETARAESAQDRVALMLSGPDCPSVRDRITAALQQQTGVVRVDADLMPDHVLIDSVRQEVTEETLAATAHAMIGGRQCRAELMKSCITAEPSSHHTHTP
jgi:hypothetical protein